MFFFGLSSLSTEVPAFNVPMEATLHHRTKLDIASTTEKSAYSKNIYTNDYENYSMIPHGFLLRQNMPRDRILISTPYMLRHQTPQQLPFCWVPRDGLNRSKGRDVVLLTVLASIPREG